MQTKRSAPTIRPEAYTAPVTPLIPEARLKPLPGEGLSLKTVLAVPLFIAFIVVMGGPLGVPLFVAAWAVGLGAEAWNRRRLRARP
jgi:hypothetical protein